MLLKLELFTTWSVYGQYDIEKGETKEEYEFQHTEAVAPTS